MATFFQWRRFNFFDLSKDVDGGEIEKIFGSDEPPTLTDTSSGRGHLILGDSQGQLHFMNRHLKIHSMRVFQRKVYLIHQMRQSGLVVVIGEDDVGVNPYMKVYNLDKPDKSGCPTLVRSVEWNRTLGVFQLIHFRFVPECLAWSFRDRECQYQCRSRPVRVRTSSRSVSRTVSYSSSAATSTGREA